jgi:hypothetical protein
MQGRFVSNNNNGSFAGAWLYLTFPKISIAPDHVIFSVPNSTKAKTSWDLFHQLSYTLLLSTESS